MPVNWKIQKFFGGYFREGIGRFWQAFDFRGCGGVALQPWLEYGPRLETKESTAIHRHWTLDTVSFTLLATYILTFLLCFIRISFICNRLSKSALVYIIYIIGRRVSNVPLYKRIPVFLTRPRKSTGFYSRARVFSWKSVKSDFHSISLLWISLDCPDSPSQLP